MTFTLVIVGRPNVGKSTLFNRLTGKRQALVDDAPGVTRDRREGEGHIADLEFTIVDTAGLEEAEAESLQGRMTAQTRNAIASADVTLMLIDGRAGVTPMDEHFAGELRKSKKPVVLAVNKAEGGKAGSAIAESYQLGLGDPVAISAEHGEGMGDLYEMLSHFVKQSSAVSHQLPENKESDCHLLTDNCQLRLAIVGRPNVGKSTLFNRILGQERTLAGPEAGITRDTIAVEHAFEGKKIKLFDTAGMRKKAGITEKVEKLAVADTLEAIRFAEVVVLVLDAEAPLERQDNAIAALVEQEGRALVIAVNKWDRVTDEAAWLKALDQRLDMVLPQVKNVPVVPVSAEKGTNIGKLLKECFRAHAVWNKEFGTGELNRWLEKALEIHTPPLVKGRRIKIRYMTQKTTRPPTFILFANTSDIPESYLRYLVNSLRERFRLPGVPVRIKIRKGENPYAKRS